MFTPVPVRTLLPLFVSAFLLACGGGASNTGSTSGLPGSNDLTNGPVSVDPALISHADSSATVAAIEYGLDPYVQPISTNFYCYDKTITDYSSPAVVISFSGLSFTMTGYGEAESGTVELSENEGSIEMLLPDEYYIQASLDFNDHGQSLKFSGSDNSVDTCYQEGASHKAALHQYLMNVPEPGVFQCLSQPSQIESDTVELMADSYYSFNGVVGSYAYTDNLGKDYSNVSFLSGPLAGESVDYYEDARYGTQTLLFYSDDSNGTVPEKCNRQRTPRPFKIYGSGTVPLPPAPAIPLAGVYFIDDSLLTGTETYSYAEYIDFRPDGFLRAGLPLPEGVDCRRTKPNGLPSCEVYDFNGQSLLLDSVFGQESIAATASHSGILTSINHTAVELITGFSVNSLYGAWENEWVAAGDLSMCILGFCSGSIDTQSMHFREDGQFLYSSSGYSYNSTVTDSVSHFSDGTTNTQGSGTFQVSGNRIVLNSFNGERLEATIFLTSLGTLVIDELQYRRPL